MDNRINPHHPRLRAPPPPHTRTHTDKARHACAAVPAYLPPMGLAYSRLSCSLPAGLRKE